MYYHFFLIIGIFQKPLEPIKLVWREYYDTIHYGGDKIDHMHDTILFQIMLHIMFTQNQTLDINNLCLIK
jgi:hypothetical protein